jgi:hypothetical protein
MSNKTFLFWELLPSFPCSARERISGRSRAPQLPQLQHIPQPHIRFSDLRHLAVKIECGQVQLTKYFPEGFILPAILDGPLFIPSIPPRRIVQPVHEPCGADTQVRVGRADTQVRPYGGNGDSTCPMPILRGCFECIRGYG